MAYVSLYRKYRPQTFAEVVGQEHVTATLANAVAENRLHHAYLFTGPRGTGKTSTARILAKALNCEAGPTATPCNSCSQCVSITRGSNVDVIEIDAASHGGVEDVRDLRERVAFAPAGARMKVYIVDECHMLSTAGWNAFLKTVEEPPGHVLFVFATTEPHRVLETILSRTQRFDLRRVSAVALSGLVRSVGEREGLEFELGVVDLLVRAGDGSARDVLSVLDQVVAFGGRVLTLEGVAGVLGTVPEQLLADTAESIAAGDVAGLCALVQRVTDSGFDPRQFARAAVEHLRELFLLQAAPDAGLVEATEERLTALRSQAGRLGRAELLRALELLAEAQAQMRRGNTRLPLEVALIKAALPEACGDPGALAARLDRLERRTGVDPVVEPSPTPRPSPRPVPEPPAAPPASARSGSAEPGAGEASAPPGGEEAAAAPAVPSASPEPAGPSSTRSGAAAVDLDLVSASWPAVLEVIKGRKRTLHAFLTEARPVGLDGGALELEFRAGYDFHAEQCAREDSQALLAEVFGEVFGAPLQVRCRVSEVRSRPPAAAGPVGSADDDEAAAVAESEAAEAAGELPDEAQAHALAVQRLTSDLDATVVDDGRQA